MDEKDKISDVATACVRRNPPPPRFLTCVSLTAREMQQSQEPKSTLILLVRMKCLRCRRFQMKGDAGSKDPRAAWAIDLIKRQLQRGVRAWFCNNCCCLNYNECLTIRQRKPKRRRTKKGEKMIEEEAASSGACLPSAVTSSTEPNREIEDPETQPNVSSVNFLDELLNQLSLD